MNLSITDKRVEIITIEDGYKKNFDISLIKIIAQTRTSLTIQFDNEIINLVGTINLLAVLNGAEIFTYSYTLGEIGQPVLATDLMEYLNLCNLFFLGKPQTKKIALKCHFTNDNVTFTTIQNDFSNLKFIKVGRCVFELIETDYTPIFDIDKMVFKPLISRIEGDKFCIIEIDSIQDAKIIFTINPVIGVFDVDNYSLTNQYIILEQFN